MEFLILVFLSFLLLTLLFSQSKKWSNWKSSKKKEQPPRLPGIHNLFQLFWYWFPRWGMANYLALEDAFKLFGSVCQLKVGNSDIIAIMDINLAKRIMSSVEWVNRLPDTHFLFERSFKKPLGLLFGNEENWWHCREFTKKTLHKLGFSEGAGTSMEAYIQIEVEETLQKLDKIVSSEQGVLRPHCLFHLPTLNILWRLLARSKILEDDPKVTRLLKYFYDWNRSFNFGATPLYIFPYLRKIKYITEHDAWVRGHEKFACFFKEIMKDRLESRKYKEEPLDFIDYFLQEMDAHKNDAKTNYFTEEQFLTICTDLFMAAADTTSNSLEFAILLMTLNQNAQRKVQLEIDDVIGADRLPSLIYKARMIWTEVTTLEILRHSCAIPITGRSSVKEMQVNGCPVAKGSQVAINIHAIHFSEQIWEDPLAFRPERFLSPSGKIINTDKIMPFGYGKRKCVGEFMSRNSFFLFFTGMLQKYSFHLSPHHPPPPKGDICGLSRTPKPFFVMIKRRCDDNDASPS